MKKVNIDFGTDDFGSLLDAARNAAATISAVYQWLERVEKAGGATCVDGVVECNAMLKSLRNNAKRTDDLIMAPLLAAIAEAESGGSRQECEMTSNTEDHTDGNDKAIVSDMAHTQDGNRPIPFDRDTLGRFVREAWVRWAQTQPNPKPSWLAPYDDLSEPDKEADRQIGEAIARWTLIGDSARTASLVGIRKTNEGRKSFIYSNGAELPYRIDE